MTVLPSFVCVYRRPRIWLLHVRQARPPRKWPRRASGRALQAQRAALGNALGAAAQGDDARPDELADAVGLQQPDQGGELVGRTGGLDRDRLGFDVDDFGA